MIKDLEADLNEADGLRVGEAFTEVFKAGMRVGAAEIIASATEQAREHGVTLDPHYRWSIGPTRTRGICAALTA